MPTINELCLAAYSNSKAHGFWDGPRNKGEMIALMHSELSEALEGIRKERHDDHLPEYPMEHVEMADAAIRIFDFLGGFGLRFDDDQADVAGWIEGIQEDYIFGDAVKGELIAQIHLFLSLAHRDSHFPAVLIRNLRQALVEILHYAARYDIPLEKIILAKMRYNESRPHKHGKKF